MFDVASDNTVDGFFIGSFPMWYSGPATVSNPSNPGKDLHVAARTCQKRPSAALVVPFASPGLGLSPRGEAEITEKVSIKPCIMHDTPVVRFWAASLVSSCALTVGTSRVHWILPRRGIFRSACGSTVE